MIIAKLMISAPSPHPPWPRFGGSHPARWRVWDLPWPALFLWWRTLLQKNVWKIGGYFQREWFRTPHDEPHDQNRCVLQVLNLYRFWPMLMSVQMNRIQVHKWVKKDIASKVYLRKKHHGNCCILSSPFFPHANSTKWFHHTWGCSSSELSKYASPQWAYM